MKEAIRKAKQMSRWRFWEMVDRFEEIREAAEDLSFLENFACYELDNFERSAKKKGFLLWGAGADGQAAWKLLKLLGKEPVIWCDSKPDEKMIDGHKIISMRQMLEEYTNEVIIIGSRKYYQEIAEQLLMQKAEFRTAIFEYAFKEAQRLHDLEYRKKAVLSYPPLWITIGVTSACPNKCLFCSYHGEDAKNVSNTYGLPFTLSLQDFKKMVDMAKEGGVPEIHICGTGEPFLNPDIFKMIDYTIEAYGEVSLQTDFWKTLFDKKDYLNELIKREKYITYIATDVMSSLEEEHDRIKKGTSYRELLETMEYIGNNSSLVIRAVLILTKQNYKHIKGIIDDFTARNVTLELLIVNLLAYGYSKFTAPDNVYVSTDTEITKALQEAAEYAKEKGVPIFMPKPADQEEDCCVFWKEFQTWPAKGCLTGRYGENMIPHACAAVVCGELNSLGYLFDYETIMDAWNNEKLVALRKNLMENKYPSRWCQKCYYYHGEDSSYKQAQKLEEE